MDANTGWALDDAEQALRVLSRYDLEYAEQPVATAEDMAALRRRVDVPVAVDELVRRAPDPRAVRWRELADVVVLKAPPLGGVRRALELADVVGLPVVVSGAMDSSVGLSAGLALAARAASAGPRLRAGDRRPAGLGRGAGDRPATARQTAGRAHRPRP